VSDWLENIKGKDRTKLYVSCQGNYTNTSVIVSHPYIHTPASFNPYILRLSPHPSSLSYIHPGYPLAHPYFAPLSRPKPCAPQTLRAPNLARPKPCAPHIYSPTLFTSPSFRAPRIFAPPSVRPLSLALRNSPNYV
jgi:hypothetical protein